MKTLQKVCRITLCGALFILMMSYPASSQEVIEVKTTRAQMSKGMQPCYFVEIPQAKLKTVQQNWKKKLQEGTLINVKEVNGELVLANEVKSEFTSDTINIYSFLLEKENKIALNVFVEINTIFFAPKGDKTDLVNDKIDNNIKNYLHAFAVDQYKLAIADELKGEQKVLETLQDDLKKLEKDEENMTKDNYSLENDIDKTEREIKELEATIDLKNQEILAHKASMTTIVSETDRKAAKEKQKDLEKERKKLEKDRSKSKDDISSYKSKIDKNNKDIEEGKRLQENKKEEITKQTEAVSRVQTKLDGVK